MTARQDNDALKAANLVKTTAEQTATALNIQYVQRDMGDMKVNFEKRIDELKASIDELKIIIRDRENIYVTTADFNEHMKLHDDLEKRTRANTDLSQTTATQLKTWGVAFAVGTTVINIALKLI